MLTGDVRLILNKFDLLRRRAKRADQGELKTRYDLGLPDASADAIAEQVKRVFRAAYKLSHRTAPLTCHLATAIDESSTSLLLSAVVDQCVRSAMFA